MRSAISIISVLALASALSLFGCYKTQEKWNSPESSGDSDSDSDIDIDVDADADADTDADTDTDTDMPTESMPGQCVQLGGTCAGLVAGCATCPPGQAPTLVAHECEFDSEWCCVDHQSGTNQCESAGGVCYDISESPDTDQIPDCPVGWSIANAMCDQLDTFCCMAGGFCV